MLAQTIAIDTFGPKALQSGQIDRRLIEFPCVKPFACRQYRLHLRICKKRL